MNKNNKDKKSQDKNKIDHNEKEGTNNNEIKKDISEEKTKLLNLHKELFTKIMETAKMVDGEAHDPESKEYLKNLSRYVAYYNLSHIITKALDSIEGSEPLRSEQIEKIEKITNDVIIECNNALADPSQYVTEVKRKSEKGYYVVYLPGNFRQAYAQEINFFENGSDEDHYRFFNKIIRDTEKERVFFGEGKRLTEARKLIKEKAPINKIFEKIDNISIYFVVMNELYPEGYPPKRKNNLAGITRESQKKELTKNGIEYMKMADERSVYTLQDLADATKPFTKEGQRCGIILKTDEVKKMKKDAVDSKKIGANAGDGITEKLLKDAGESVIDLGYDPKYIELIDDIVNAEDNAGKTGLYLPDLYKSIQNSKDARAGIEDVNNLKKIMIEQLEDLAGIIKEEDGTFTYCEMIEISIPVIKDVTGNPDATIIIKSLPYLEEIRRRANEMKNRAEMDQEKKYRKAIDKKGRAKKPNNFIIKTAIAKVPTINEPKNVRDICDRITKTVLTANTPNPHIKITTILEDCPQFVASIAGKSEIKRKNEQYKRTFINVLDTLANPSKYIILKKYPDIEISSDNKTFFKLKDLTRDYIKANMETIKTLIPTEKTKDKVVYYFKKNKIKNNEK